ncbi:MAG: hypothetical protein ACJAYR_000999 [Sneathiella sp.]|jgi:hypothetical protein
MTLTNSFLGNGLGLRAIWRVHKSGFGQKPAKGVFECHFSKDQICNQSSPMVALLFWSFSSAVLPELNMRAVLTQKRCNLLKSRRLFGFGDKIYCALGLCP